MSSFLSDLNWLDEFTRAEMARWGVPGVAIGVFLNGEFRTAGYGTVNVKTGYLVLPETIFQTGSISKTFTAALVLQLVDNDIFDLDTPVVTYVPELPLADETARRSITLRYLLTHTAGFFGERYDDHGSGDDALTRAVAAFSTLPQQAPPGEVWAYASWVRPPGAGDRIDARTDVRISHARTCFSAARIRSGHLLRVRGDPSLRCGWTQLKRRDGDQTN